MKNNPKLAALQARHAEQLAELERESAIIAALPDDLPDMPTISNICNNPKPLNVHAWLSFSAPSYDPNKIYNPLAIIRSLEGAEWKAEPATLCRWNDYRPAAYPGAVENIPTEYDKRTLKESSPIAPLWVRMNQFTSAEVEFFTRSPDGKLYRVLIDTPYLASVHARRIEYPGGWRFQSGSARLSYPDGWNTLEYCTVHMDSRAYMDTQQGISGCIYFAPRSSWSLTLAAFLEQLLQTPTPTR